MTPEEEDELRRKRKEKAAAAAAARAAGQTPAPPPPTPAPAAAPPSPAPAPTTARPAIVPTPVPSPPRRRGLPDDIFLAPPEESPAPQRDVLDVALSRGRDINISAPNAAPYRPPGYIGTFAPGVDEPGGRGPARAGLAAPGKGGTVPHDPEVAIQEDLREAQTEPRIQARANEILRDEGVKASLAAAHGDSDTFISNRASQLLAARGIKQEDTDPAVYAAEDTKAKAEALDELAYLRTVGLWSTSIFAPGAGGVLGPAAPRVEIMGVKRGRELANPGSGENALQGYIYRVQSPGSYAMDLVSAPVYLATATGLPDLAARALAGTERDAPERPPLTAETARRALAERRTFSDVARETAPTSDWGRVGAAVVGAAADVFMPDPVFIFHKGRQLVGGVARAVEALPEAARGLRGSADAMRNADSAIAAAERVLDAPRPRLGASLDQVNATAARVDDALAKLGDTPLARTVKQDAARRVAMKLEQAGIPEAELSLLRAGRAEEAVRGATASVDTPTGALRNLAGRYTPARPVVGPAPDVPLAGVVSAATEAAAREALAEARAVLQSTAKSEPAAAPTVIGLIADLRGQTVAQMAASKSVGKKSIAVTRAELGKLLRRDDLQGLSGVVADKILPIVSRSGDEVGVEIPLAMVARMDNALAEASMASAGAGSGVIDTLARPSVGAVGSAVDTAKRAAKVVLEGDSVVAEFARTTGLGEAAREGMKRVSRAMEAASAGVLKDLSKGPVTIDSAKKALKNVPVPETTSTIAATTPDSVVIALYSPEQIAIELERLAPGSAAYARAVADGTIKLEGGLEMAFKTSILDRLPPRAPPEHIRAVAAWVGAHGGASHPLLEMFGAGVLLTPAEAQALGDVDDLAALASKGTIYPTVRPQVLAEAASGLRDGVVVQKLFEGSPVKLVNDFYGSVWVPSAVRDAIAKGGRAAAGKVTAPALTAEAARSLWSRGVTRGLLAPRPGYLLNNTFGNVEQIFIQHGTATAIKYAIRAELQSLAAVAGVAGQQLGSRALGGVGSAVANLGVSAAMGTRLGKESVDAVLNLMTYSGEALSRVVGMSSNYPGIAKILDASDDTVVLGGRVYRYKDLYAEAARGGVLDSFDAADLGTAAESLRKFLPAEGVQHFAEAVSIRQRVGLYATLIDSGKSPAEAAKGVVEALYDYRHTLTESEKGFVRWLLPFWTWQKNAQRQLIGAMSSPESCYRLTTYLKARRTVADLTDQFAASDYDQSGVGVGRFPQGYAESYARVEAWLDKKGIPRGDERNQYILNWSYQAGKIDADPSDNLDQLNEDMMKVQEFTQPIAWRSYLPTSRRDAASSRVPGHEDSLAWAMPPSGMLSAINYTAAWLAVSLAAAEGLVGLATGSQSARAVDVFTENIIDPERVPLSTAFVRDRVVLSDEMGQLIDSISPFGFSGAERVSRSEVDDAGNLTSDMVWVVQGTGTIFMLDVTGLLAYDRQLKRTQPGALGDVGLGVRFLSAAGIQFFPLDGGEQFEWRAAEARERQVPQRTLAQEVLDEAATKEE